MIVHMPKFDHEAYYDQFDAVGAMELQHTRAPNLCPPIAGGPGAAEMAASVPFAGPAQHGSRPNTAQQPARHDSRHIPSAGLVQEQVFLIPIHFSPLIPLSLFPPLRRCIPFNVHLLSLSSTGQVIPPPLLSPPPPPPPQTQTQTQTQTPALQSEVKTLSGAPHCPAPCNTCILLESPLYS